MSGSSIASSSVNSWGRSTFDSRSGGFRTSSSPHPSASSKFLGVNNSLADAVKHVWGASANPQQQQQKDQQQRMLEQRQRAVSAHVLDNTTKHSGVVGPSKLQQQSSSTFQQALHGVTSNSLHRDGTAVDSARGQSGASQFNHFFKGQRVPVLNQNGVPHGDMMLTETSPLRLSALAGKIHTFGKAQQNPDKSAEEAEKKRLAKMTPTERQQEHEDKMKKQTSAMLMRNFSALNSSLLGSNGVDRSGLPKFMQEELDANKEKEKQQQQQQQQSTSSARPLDALQATATKLTTEALAAAALTKIEQDRKPAAASPAVGNPSATAAVPPLFYASRENSTTIPDDTAAISLPDLIGETSAVSRTTAAPSSSRRSTTSDTARPGGFGRQQQQQQPASSSSATSSARGSARRHVDVSAIGHQQQNQSSWDAYAGTPYSKHQRGSSIDQQQASARRLEAVYGGSSNNNNNNNSRSRTPVRSTTPSRRGGGDRQQANLQQQQQQQQQNLSEAPAALFYSARQQGTDKANTAQAVLAASHLFVRTIGAEATAGSIDVSASTAATLHLKNSQAQQNLSLMSTVSQIRRTAHAEFAELYQQCENLWAELGTSIQARERASYALFPMLFSGGGASSFGSTQLASHRATVVKYINRLSTQLELTVAANDAMNARDGAVFDIIVVSKRYTDYVKSTFGTATGWKEKATRQGAAVASKDEQSSAEAAAATTQATAMKHELRVALHKYRVCTLVAVEGIAKWMEFTGRVDFWWRGRPALLHMCVDLHQLAFSRRPLLYLLGFDVVHNPFVLPGEKWYVIPRRERRLQSVSQGRASSMQQRASSAMRDGDDDLHAFGGGGAAIVGLDGRGSSKSRSRSAASNPLQQHCATSSQRQAVNAGAADTLGNVWGGASKHKTVSVIDPRRKDGEAQNFILVNEMGEPLQLGANRVLSSARSASIASHQKMEHKEKQKQEQLNSIRRHYSPEQQQQQSSSPNQYSAVPDFQLPVSATTVAHFWRQMESEDFEIRTRMESAIVLMRHAVLQCIVPIQACAKRFVGMLRYRSTLAKIRRLQRYVREWVARRELERAIKVAACRFLYKVFNGYAVRFELGKMRRAAMALQRWWRGTMDRRWLAHRAETAMRVQRWMRPIVRKVINQRRARVRKIQLLHAVARGYLERRRFWHWAAQTLSSRRRQIASVMHIERERRVEIQKLYWEATCFGLFSATTSSSSSSTSRKKSSGIIERQLHLDDAADSDTSSSNRVVASSSSVFSPFLLCNDEFKTLPSVLRPVHGPLGSWAQLSLLFHASVFRDDILRLQFLNCAAEERYERLQIAQQQEKSERLAHLVPAKALLRCVETEIRYCEQARAVLQLSLEPSSRFIISDTFRRERYHIYVQCENSARLVELQRLETMRRNLMMQAEHDARIKAGISPLSTALSCELLEKEERRRISGVAAQTLAFEMLSMVPDYESLRRESISMRWLAVVGFFSGDHSQQQQQQHGDGDEQQLGMNKKQLQQQRELFMMLSPLRSGAVSISDFASSPSFALDSGGGGMQIAHQIELLHLSSEEEIARDKLSQQILTAPVWGYVAKYSLLMRNMTRQFAVLSDAQAYAWVKLMSCDGSNAAAVEAETESLVAAAMQNLDAQQQQQDQEFSERELFPSPDMKPKQPLVAHQQYVSSRWQGRLRGATATSTTTRTGSRFVPNISSSVLNGGVSTPQRAAIHNFAIKHSTPTPIKERGEDEPSSVYATSSSSNSFANMSEIALASANPVLFRALISHARRLQRIGRAYLDRSGPVFFFFCESQDRKEIVQDSIAELYVIVEELKRDKITITESAQRAQKQQQVRMALGLVEALCKKKEQYRLRRLAAKLVIYPVIARRYNEGVSVSFEPQQRSMIEEESRRRDHVASLEEQQERGRLVHEYLLSAERTMTVTIRRRWSEHEEMIAKTRATDAQNQRRERVLQDKIYELLQQKDGDVGAVTAEANRLLAREMAETERIKEVMWGTVRAQQLFAEEEKQLLVSERAARAAVAAQEGDRRAAIGRESAQAAFLNVCSVSPPRGVDPPLSLFAGSRAGLPVPDDNGYSSSLLSPEVRHAAKSDRGDSNQQYFQWLASRTGVPSSATYGEIQPLLSPPPPLTKLQHNQFLVDSIGVEEVAPWHRNIPLQQRSGGDQNNNSSNAAEEHLLSQLTPIVSPASAQRASARGAALKDGERQRVEAGRSLSPREQQQQQSFFDESRAGGGGFSFLSTNSAVSPGLVSAPSVQRGDDDGFSPNQQQQPHRASDLSSADASVAAVAFDALSRVVDVPRTSSPQRQRNDDDDDLFGFDDGGADDIWAAHDAAFTNEQHQQQQLLQRPSPPRIVDVPRSSPPPPQQSPQPLPPPAEDYSPPATAPIQQQQPSVVSPPPILGVHSSRDNNNNNVRKKQPSLERNDAAESNSKQSRRNLPIAFGVATSSHPSVDRQDGAYSVSSARDSASRKRIIVKKAAVVQHPGGTIMSSSKFSSLPPRRDTSQDRSFGSSDEDDNNNNNNNNSISGEDPDGQLLLASARTAQSVAAAKKKQQQQQQSGKKTNEELKSQYEYEKELFSSASMFPSAGNPEPTTTTAPQHLDSSRGAIAVPRGALRPQSAGERNNKKKSIGNNNSSVAVPNPGATTPPSSRAATPSLRSMQLLQQQDQHSGRSQHQQQQQPPHPTSQQRGSARSGTAAGNSNSTSLMSLFQKEKTNTSLLSNPNNNSSTTNASSSVSSARRMFGSGRLPLTSAIATSPPHSGDSWSPTSGSPPRQQEASPPLNWTAHAAAMSNRDSDVPEQLQRLQSFVGKVKSSVDHGKKMRSSSNNTSLLRRASDVMTEEEIAEMELERAQEAEMKERERATRAQRQQQFISNSSGVADSSHQHHSGLVSSSDFLNSNNSQIGSGPVPGALGLGQVTSPDRVRVNDAAFHYRYFNSNGEPADTDLLRSNISGAMQRASFSSLATGRNDDDDDCNDASFVVAQNPQLAHRYGIVHRPSSAPKNRMSAQHEMISRVVDMVESDEAARQQSSPAAQSKIVSPLTSGGMQLKKLAATRRQLQQQVEIDRREMFGPESTASRTSPARSVPPPQLASSPARSASSANNSPGRKTVRFVDELPSQKKEAQQPPKPTQNRIVLRRAHEVLTPEKENEVHLPRTSSSSGGGGGGGDGASPPEIFVQSPSLPRSPAVGKLAVGGGTAAAAAGGARGTKVWDINTSNASSSSQNLSAQYKSDVPWLKAIL